MTVKILDVPIPLFGAIIFRLLYAEILPLKKNRDEHKCLYERTKNFLLLMSIASSLACVLIALIQAEERSPAA